MKNQICTDEYAEDLAQFCKRVTFEDAYRRSHGETEEERKAMAYRILRALGEVQEYLNHFITAPR